MGLPAMAAYQPTKMLELTASSRASPLLQGIYGMRRSTVGASLLAMAVYQPTRMLELMASSRASPLLQGIYGMRRSTVGASLLAMAVDLPAKMLELMASSRAGSLLQGLCGAAQALKRCYQSFCSLKYAARRSIRRSQAAICSTLTNSSGLCPWSMLPGPQTTEGMPA